jgi:hypothetical protein
MAANRSGLQMATLRNVVLAWVLTLPVCVFLGATMFSAGLYAVFHGPIAVTMGIVLLGALALLAWKLLRAPRPGRRLEPDAQAQPAT